MEGINRVESTVSYVYSTEEAMAPPEEERAEVQAIPTNDDTHQRKAEVTLLKPGKSVGFGNIKFKPIDGYIEFKQASPTERIKYFGYWNPIKNVNLYIQNSMYRGIGSFINIRV